MSLLAGLLLGHDDSLHLYTVEERMQNVNPEFINPPPLNKDYQWHRNIEAFKRKVVDSSRVYIRIIGMSQVPPSSLAGAAPANFLHASLFAKA